MRKSILGIISIILGGIIYIIWRKETLLMFDWFDLFGLSSFINSIRYFVGPILGGPPEWFLFSFPNALWLFGGIFLFSSIWDNQSFEQLIWVLIFSTIALGSELAQLLGYVPGTYDTYDMFFMLVFGTLAILINKKRTVREVIDAKSV